MGGRRKRSRWRAQINISAGVGHPAYSLRPCLHLADLLLSSPPCIAIPGQHSFFSLLTPPLLPSPLPLSSSSLSLSLSPSLSFSLFLSLALSVSPSLFFPSTFLSLSISLSPASLSLFFSLS